MYWPYLSRQDVVGILTAAVIFGVLLGAYLIVPGLMSPNSGLKTNAGFGPEWECSNPGNGGPVCVKHPAKTTNSN